MTKLLERALRQIEHLTEAEQDAAARALLDYVKYMRDLRLTGAQIAELRGRRKDPDANWYPTPRRASVSRGLEFGRNWPNHAE
jgi:hypothetical protein